MSFTINAGETVTLVGPSGGGKSSCVSLMEHYFEPTSGDILLDDVPIRDYDHIFLHNSMSLVMQEPVLFDRSISKNIAYDMPSVDDDEVRKAARMANAHTFVSEFDEGCETKVGENGIQLSGGQKQRIAIARALIRQLAIILLDEATSSQDTESEMLVQEAIYKNLKSRTVLMIAHRLSTVKRADRIFVINKGRIEQIGSHTELLKQEGIYRNLVQRQLLGYAEDEECIAASANSSVAQES